MFFIGIFGFKNDAQTITEVHFPCTECLNEKVNLIELYMKFEFFFIPIFRFNKKYVIECTNCHSFYLVKKESIEKILKTKEVTYDDISDVIHKSKVCPKCKTVLNASFSYCPNCGEVLKK